MTWRMVLAGLALLAGTAPAWTEAKQLQPFQMVRALQLVQDRVADGDLAALPIQRKLLEMIDQRLRTATDAEMVEPQQFRALLIYSMSGGNPTTLETLMRRLRLSEDDARKCIGILSYLKGGTKAAATALEKVEPMNEKPELGAFLALVKGSVLTQEKPQDALKYLAQARLISPGTLVEEAALRRSMPLLIAAKDFDAIPHCVRSVCARLPAFALRQPVRRCAGGGCHRASRNHRLEAARIHRRLDVSRAAAGGLPAYRATLGHRWTYRPFAVRHRSRRPDSDGSQG